MKDDINSSEEHDDSVSDEYTIPSEPPERRRPQRRSWWTSVFSEARRYPNEWRLVCDTYTKSTAGQIASDVRNAHRRAPEKMRVRGIAPGERWGARSAPDPGVGPDQTTDWLVWIKFKEFVAHASESINASEPVGR